MAGALADLRFTLAALSRRRALAAASVGLLAVAMCVFSLLVAVAGSLLFRPLAYPSAARLGVIRGRWAWGEGPVSFETLRTLRERARSLERVEGFALRQVALERDGRGPELVPAVAVTPGALELLGGGVGLGRALAAADAAEGASPVAVVSWRLWRDPGGEGDLLLGRTLRLADGPRRVVGVVRRGFSFPLLPGMGAGPRVFLPYRPPASTARLRTRDLFLLVRRAPGASWETVRRELESLASDRGERLAVAPLRAALLGSAGGALRALLVAAALIAALAACNLAMLVLARTDARGAELAVRVATGASPLAAVRLVVLEAVLLAGAGTALGLGAASLLGGWLRGALPRTLPRVAPVRVDWWVALVVAGVCVAAAAAAAAPSVAAVLRVSYASVIKGVGSLSGGGRWAGRLRRWLVAAEVGIAAAALAVTAAVVASAARLLRAPLGFEPARVVTAMVRPLPPQPAPTVEQALTVAGRLGPGVERAAVATAVPLGGTRADVDVAVAGRGGLRARVCYVSEGYFDVLGIRVVAGRGFRRDEVREGAPVAVVSRRLARTLAGGGVPGGTLALAQELAPGAPVVRVVGVVADVAADGPAAPPAPTVYLPFGLDLGGSFAAIRAASPTFVVARTGLPAGVVAARVRRALAASGARAAVPDAARLASRVAAALEQTLLLRRVLGGLALAALALACGGVYGLVAFWLVQRRRELGVRAACGASAGRIARDLVGEVARLVVPAAAAGAVAGVAVAWRLATRIPGLDPPGISTVAAVLLVAAVAGIVGAVPGALRATRMDPAAALRYE